MMQMQSDMLVVDKISVGYGGLQILWDVSIKLPEGKLITVLGPNSAGKSTLLKTIAGLLSTRAGNITYRGNIINGLPAEKIVCELGINYVPHLPGLIFSSLTVRENLELSVARLKLRGEEFRGRLKKIFDLFPTLEGLLTRSADRLSGGERQMLNISMALMRNPQVLMLDEPSAGLAPKLKKELFEKIAAINKQGISILLVEQDVVRALSLSDYGYVIKGGRVAFEGDPDYLLKKKEALYF
jgi:branched-chain amino acid transport system ATP-binding protein